jgi:rhomboid protease GluP
MVPYQRNSFLCPNCRKLISSDEPQCPYCGITNPGSWWKNNAWTRRFSDADQLIKTIIFTNIGMYILTLLIEPRLLGLSMNPLSFLSPAKSSLLFFGATGTIPIDRWHRWWSLISANFLHGSILHILFNMMAFKQLAPLAAREYGSYRMFLIYIISGTIGFWVSYLLGVQFTIGASAAVFGLMGAILYYGKSRGGIYGQTVYKQVGSWALVIFLFGLLVPGINNWSHGGGLAAGTLLGFLLGYHEKKPERFFHNLLAGLCALLTILVLARAVISGIYYRFLM